MNMTEMKDQVVEAVLPDRNRQLFRAFHIAEAEVIVDIYENGHYAQLELKSGETLLDVGAHIGAFTLRAAKQVGVGGKIVAFEPEPGNFKLLQKNIEINRYSNVIPTIVKNRAAITHFILCKISAISCHKLTISDSLKALFSSISF
ncbi:MAG TPA: FkbM family methyltransferase [Candidatus Methanoperedenaceae archaeon]|nr:FkbM family methyltransferase [Candidatus Methanoperedenaceae archaeon]